MATANRIVDASAGVSQRPSREGVGRPSEPACILVADGDPLTLDLIEFKLTSRGYSVLTAADGEMAVASALNYRPSLIVLDARLPLLDGFEALKRLRGDRRTESIPVIMLTTRKHDHQVLAALAVGAQDYLAKPFLPEQLVRRVGKLLANSGRSFA